MTAGQQPTLELINNTLTSAAVRLHALASEITDLHLQVTKLGTAGLQALGASAQDATDITTAWNVIATVSAVYFGTAATPAYNFDDALAPYRAGQAG
jgi:hypothetical protein